jgi:DNA-binding CsgD family transcriptional regulator
MTTPLATYSEHLKTLIPKIGWNDFNARLIGMLKELVPIDDATIIYFPVAGMPVIEHFETPRGSKGSTLHMYVKGAFLLDPYYLAGTEQRKNGLFRLRDLAPKGFRDSEYYKTYYLNIGYQDECGYVIPVSEEGFVNISFGKLAPRTSFTKKEVTLLQDIHPVVEMLCQQHWADPEPDESGINLRAHLNNALEAFGSSLLTERESQVINLVLHGHSTRTVAEKLSISMETVKLHRKHAYAKLEVSSQAELFYLFLDSVMSANNYAGGDTLVAYMQKPGETP